MKRAVFGLLYVVRGATLDLSLLSGFPLQQQRNPRVQTHISCSYISQLSTRVELNQCFSPRPQSTLSQQPHLNTEALYDLRRLEWCRWLAPMTFSLRSSAGALHLKRLCASCPAVLESILDTWFLCTNQLFNLTSHIRPHEFGLHDVLLGCLDDIKEK